MRWQTYLLERVEAAADDRAAGVAVARRPQPTGAVWRHCPVLAVADVRLPSTAVRRRACVVRHPDSADQLLYNVYKK